MPALTLLHGFMQTSAAWDEQRSLLGDGWTVIAPDLPGFGDGRGAEATMPAAAAALVALWDRLEVDRTHLVGYSLGGRLALYVATQHPDRIASLLTIGAHAGLEGDEREQRLRADLALADRVERDGIDWFAGYWAAQPLFSGLARRGPAYLADLDRRRRALDPSGVAASLRGMGAAATDPFWDRLQAITCPATFVAGAEDARYAQLAERLTGAVPGAQLRLLPQAGHAAHLEQPYGFAGMLQAHLAPHHAPAR